MRSVFANDGGRIERFEFAGRVQNLEYAIFRSDDVLDLPAECGTVQVAEAHSVRAADLVPVTGADAAAGRADVLAVRRVLVERAVLSEVPGENYMRPVA